MTNKTDVAECISALRACGDIKVWSLIVTIFGDLAGNRGDFIAGTALSQIMDQIGIRPEATRVALHRLRKDGWICAEKSGRISHYSLTETARTQTQVASPRIYGAPPQRHDEWWLSIMPEGAEFDQSGTISLHSNQIISPFKMNNVQALNAVIDSNQIPQWIIDFLLPQKQNEALLKLDKVLQNPPKSRGLEPLETAALRILALHNWRRLILRHPAILEAFLPETWIGARCRVSVAKWLGHFQIHDPQNLSKN